VDFSFSKNRAKASKSIRLSTNKGHTGTFQKELSKNKRYGVQSVLFKESKWIILGLRNFYDC
jgi:hypothetical protein